MPKCRSGGQETTQGVRSLLSVLGIPGHLVEPWWQYKKSCLTSLTLYQETLFPLSLNCNVWLLLLLAAITLSVSWNLTSLGTVYNWNLATAPPHWWVYFTVYTVGKFHPWYNLSEIFLIILFPGKIFMS